jgi:RNA polymerase sigma factor (sigma-70 family)
LVAPLEVSRCEELALAGANGDSEARKRLVEYLWPFWINRVRTRNGIRTLAQAEDHVHNVVARLVQKVLDPEVLRSYARFRESAPGVNFVQWLHTVTDNEALDYFRSIAGRASGARDTDSGPSAKLLLNEFATSPLLEELGVRPPNTELQTAQELLTFAQNRLPSDQLRAITLWIQGATDEEAALQLNLPDEQCRALRRAAVARLRREFAPDGLGD